jgi:uncharacterized membrane protein
VTTHTVLLYLHIVGGTVLFGTGLGIAFFLFVAVRSQDVRVIAGTLRAVVVADFLFTAPAVMIQLVTGVLLARELGMPLATPWLAESLALFGLVGLCWLPVVAMQIRMRAIVEAAVKAGGPLPAEFDNLYRTWFALGLPAFVGVLGILALMVFKP